MISFDEFAKIELRIENRRGRRVEDLINYSNSSGGLPADRWRGRRGGRGGHRGLWVRLLPASAKYMSRKI